MRGRLGRCESQVARRAGTVADVGEVVVATGFLQQHSSQAHTSRGNNRCAYVHRRLVQLVAQINNGGCGERQRNGVGREYRPRQKNDKLKRKHSKLRMS